jgi:hypothetical protein
MPILTDAQLLELDGLVNATISELVFLRQHAEQGDQDDAGNCHMTIGGNLERIGALLFPSAE